jgi:amidase
MTDPVFMPAVTLAGHIARREISCVEVLRAHIDQIERVDPKVNAMVTRTYEDAGRVAADLDARLARGESPGPLAGLPVAHKDLALTKGVRTTFGSPLFRDFVPEADGLLVMASRGEGFGRFQCEAAIQSVHAARKATGRVDAAALETQNVMP